MAQSNIFSSTSPSSSGIRLSSCSSTGSYIDFEFPPLHSGDRDEFHDYSSDLDNGKNFIEISFSKGLKETVDSVGDKPDDHAKEDKKPSNWGGDPETSDGLAEWRGTPYAGGNANGSDGEFKRVNPGYGRRAAVFFQKFPEMNLHASIMEFYSALELKLDSLRLVGNVNFLAFDFLMESIKFLHYMEKALRSLVCKLVKSKGVNSKQAIETIAEYNEVHDTILDVCVTLKFSMTMLKGYQNSQVEAAMAGVEAFIAIPWKSPRAIHVQKARNALNVLELCITEKTRIQVQVEKVAKSKSICWKSFLYLYFFDDEAKWASLRGVFITAKASTSYICQLLLWAFADLSEGPTFIFNKSQSNSGWILSLMKLHMQLQKQLNKWKINENKKAFCFMSRDSKCLEYMLDDTKGHFDSLLDQGKLLNFGYIGSGKNERKAIKHNAPLMRQHIILVRDRLAVLLSGVISLISQLKEGKLYVASH